MIEGIGETGEERRKMVGWEREKGLVRKREK